MQQVVLTVTDTYTRWHWLPKTIRCFEEPEIYQSLGMNLASNVLLFVCHTIVYAINLPLQKFPESWHIYLVFIAVSLMYNSVTGEGLKLYPRKS